MSDTGDRPSDVDLTSEIDINNLPEHLKEYFHSQRPDSTSAVGVKSLRDMLDPSAGIKLQTALYEYVEEIINSRRDSAPSLMEMDLETSQYKFMWKYSYAIPSVNALEYLSKQRPLIELFSGNGYWAYELEKRGCAVTPIDAKPPRDTWVDVKKGTQDILLDYAENQSELSLFLCWPPVGPSAYESLLIARPSEVFFIGECPGDGFKIMADDKFFKLLSARYTCIHEIPLPRYMGHQDSLYHYVRSD